MGIALLLKKKELREVALLELKQNRTALVTKSAELDKKIEEVRTEDDYSALESEITENDNAITKTDEKIKEVEQDINNIEEEIERAKKTIDLATGSTNVGTGIFLNYEQKERGIQALQNLLTRATTDAEKRARMKNVIDNCEETRAFLDAVYEMRTGISNTDLLIPEIIIDMIEVDTQFVGNVYNLVRKQTIKGTTRITLAGETPKAVWTEQEGAIKELANLTFSAITLDGFKVGGFLAVHNNILEDSRISLGVHIVEQITTAINKAYDEVIINGEGDAKKQPTGIIPSLPATNKVKISFDFASIIKLNAKLPDDCGSTTMLMTRKTYYERFAPQTVLNTSDGRVVAQSFSGVRMPDGTPVVFVKNNIIKDDQFLLGDFSKYFFVNRRGMEITHSTEIKFIEEQTVFKGSARCDGKPIKNNYWVLATLDTTAPATP